MTREVTMHGNPLTVIGKSLTIGDAAPDFKLLDNSLELKTLADYGDAVKLLSIVPSLDTGVCDLQTRQFNEDMIEQPGAIVITVSVDLPFAQKRWCGNAGLKEAITLSDHRDVSFGKAYGVLIEELRLLARAVFAADRQNKITYVEYLKEMTDHPNYEAAIKALSTLF